MREECEWDIAGFKVQPGGDHVIACEVSGPLFREGRRCVLSLWDLATEAMDGDGGELYGPCGVGGELSARGHEVYRWAVAAMGPPPPDGDARWNDCMSRYDVPAREGADTGGSGLEETDDEGWEPDAKADGNGAVTVEHAAVWFNPEIWPKNNK